MRPDSMVACQVCGERRVTKFIARQINPVTLPDGTKAEAVVLYCNDKAECGQYAATFTHTATQPNAALAERTRRPVGE